MICVDQIEGSRNCITILQAYKCYTQTLTERGIRNFRTALLRFTVPGMGGKASKGGRMTEREIEAALDLLNKTPVTMLLNAVKIQQSVMEKFEVSLASQRVYKCYLKSFVDWAVHEKLVVQEPEDNPKPYRFRHKPKPVKRFFKVRQSYTLKQNEINETLREQLEALKEFCYNVLQHRMFSIDKEISDVCRFLGWLHRYKGVPLENLRLESIIPYVQLKFDEDDFTSSDECDLAEKRAERRCNRVADKVAVLLDEYFQFRKARATSNLRVVTSIINVAKYVFRNEKNRRQGYNCIPIILELNYISKELERKAKQEGLAIAKEERMVLWNQVLEALEKLRHEADMPYTERLQRRKIRRMQRPPTAIAQSLQKFLLLAFFTLIPPMRQRTIRELEAGRTLVQGIRDNEIFVPIEQMKTPWEAQWWIHLMPEDYKTGKSHGELWIPVANVTFSDGKNFYGYIDRWLNEGRSLFNPDHAYFFMKTHGNAKGKPMDAGNLCSRVKYILRASTGVPVNPHTLRDIYVTFLKRCGATQEELAATALMMGHSLKVQGEIYNQQSKKEKMEPGVKYLQNVLDTMLGV